MDDNEIKVGLDCEYCFTKSYDEAQILELVWKNMTDDTYNKICTDIFDASDYKEGISEQDFYKYAKLSWNFTINNEDTKFENDDTVVSIDVGFSFDINKCRADLIK